jgi:hypothetical protein
MVPKFVFYFVLKKPKTKLLVASIVFNDFNSKKNPYSNSLQKTNEAFSTMKILQKANKHCEID